MALERARVSLSTRRKLGSITLSIVVFAALAGLASVALGRPAEYSVSNAILTGVGVGLFEEFYVQTLRGRWLRGMHPLRSILVYCVIVAFIYLAAVHITHLVLGHWYELPTIYRRLPVAIPMFIAFAAIGIMVIRVVHFIGAENLFHLMIGSYHRPILKRMIFVFVDMNGSTAIAGRLGPFKMSALVGKFLFDIAKPITDWGGEIYLYKGDGLIAVWEWQQGVRKEALLRAIDAMFAAVAREESTYFRAFGVAPAFRVGVHGGDAVVSVQGDTRRSIGIYGDAINIAARMEEAAKAHGVPCVVSGDVAAAFGGRSDRFRPLGDEIIRGVGEPIPIFECRPEYSPARRKRGTAAARARAKA